MAAAVPHERETLVVVRSRYAAGLKNLFMAYMPVVDTWEVYGNPDLAGARLLAFGGHGKSTTVTNAPAWHTIQGQR